MTNFIGGLFLFVIIEGKITKKTHTNKINLDLFFASPRAHTKMRRPPRSPGNRAPPSALAPSPPAPALQSPPRVITATGRSFVLAVGLPVIAFVTLAAVGSSTRYWPLPETVR